MAGITAETFAHSISQFDQKFRLVRVPVDSTEKAHATIARSTGGCIDGRRSIVHHARDARPMDRAAVQCARAEHVPTFIEPLELELDIKSTHAMGRVHQNADTDEYKNRIRRSIFRWRDDGQSIAISPI